MRVWKYSLITLISLVLTSLTIVTNFISSLHQGHNFVSVSETAHGVGFMGAPAKKMARAISITKHEVRRVEGDREVTTLSMLNNSSSSEEYESIMLAPLMENRIKDYHEEHVSAPRAGVTNQGPGWRPLTNGEMDSVKYFLIFLGWPRSCHSIIGSMLDAHPNVIVAHEYYLFQKLSQQSSLDYSRRKLFNDLYSNSFLSARKGWRASNQTQKGYSLNIDKSWQGQFTKLRVMGDKCGGDAMGLYINNRVKFKTVYRVLKANVKVPIKVLQIVRNPFDMIATITLYRGSGVREVKVNATETQKYTNHSLLQEATSFILETSSALQQMVSELKLSPLEVHCEDLISHPAETMSTICQFLGLECSREYLQMCVDKTFKNVSVSRHLVEWDPATLPSLISTIRTFPFFHRYSFD